MRHQRLSCRGGPGVFLLRRKHCENLTRTAGTRRVCVSCPSVNPQGGDPEETGETVRCLLGLQKSAVHQPWHLCSSCSPPRLARQAPAPPATASRTTVKPSASIALTRPIAGPGRARRDAALWSGIRLPYPLTAERDQDAGLYVRAGCRHSRGILRPADQRLPERIPRHPVTVASGPACRVPLSAGLRFWTARVRG